MATMKVARVRRMSDDAVVILLTAAVTPTVKTPQYWTTLMMGEADAKYLSGPFSGCDCPAGQLFCSHMLALLLYVMLIQQHGDVSYDTMLVTLPPPVISMQTVPVPFSFLYR